MAPLIASLHLHWFREMPQWEFGVIVVGVFVVVGVGGQMLVRPWLRRWLGGQDFNEAVGQYIAAFGVLYGITLGLISVAAWANFGDVESKVSAEAAAIAALYRNVDSYPEPIRTELTGLLRNYTRQMIDEDWPQMEHGLMPQSSRPLAMRFQKTLLGFEPKTTGQGMLHREALYRLNQLIEARRLRLDCVEWRLPTILWVVVLVGSFMSFVLMWLLVAENKLLHDVMTGIMAVLLGLLIFFLVTLDLPFEGQDPVGPDSFELVFQQVMTAQP